MWIEQVGGRLGGHSKRWCFQSRAAVCGCWRGSLLSTEPLLRWAGTLLGFVGAGLPGPLACLSIVRWRGYYCDLRRVRRRRPRRQKACCLVESRNFSDSGLAVLLSSGFQCSALFLKEFVLFVMVAPRDWQLLSQRSFKSVPSSKAKQVEEWLQPKLGAGPHELQLRPSRVGSTFDDSGCAHRKVRRVQVRWSLCEALGCWCHCAERAEQV